MRVKQAIEDQEQSHMATLTRFTADLDKGKGHVFSYPDSDHSSQARQRSGPSVSVPLRKNMAGQEGYSDSESSGTVRSLEPAITTGFQIGVSSQTPSAGDSKVVKAVRRRPPCWKRKAQAEKAISKRNSSSELALTPMESGSKRKSDTVHMSLSKKVSIPTSNSACLGSGFSAFAFEYETKR
ncbi:hypothetical protein YC2023_015114 [Brassica napus]